MAPYEFLTLTPAEARLVVHSQLGHLRTEGIAARDELTLSIGDSCGPDAEGDRLDVVHGVADWRSLVQRIHNLTEAQAAAVLDACAAFWNGDLSLYTDEALQQVGLL